MPVLPVERSIGVARRKRAASPQPSSADVQIVSPAVSRDPGVTVPTIRVPEGAFDSPLSAAEELTPAFEELEQVAIREENRKEAVNLSENKIQYDQITDAELRRLNTEADLSNEDVLREYGEFLEEKKQEILNSHTGSADSFARLTIRLQDIQAVAIGRASGLSVKLGRQKVMDTFDNAITPLATSAATDPSKANIDQLFLDLDSHVDDMAGAFTVSEERALIETGREHISLSALDGLITSGRVEQAEILLADPGVLNSLSPEFQRSVRKRIQTIKFERDEFVRKINQAEAARGRPFTPDERVQFVGALYGVNSSEELVEIGDPDSPTGSRFVPESQAVGKPGRPRQPLSVVNVSVDTSEESFAKEFGKVNAKQFFERRKSAQDAVVSLQGNTEARKLLDSGVITGKGAEFITGFNNFLIERLGFDVGKDEVANTEAFLAAQAKQVAGIIKAFGAGTGLSDADREFAEKAAGGKITMTEQSIRRILAINDRASRNVIVLFNKDAKTIDSELSPFPLAVEIPEGFISTPEETKEETKIVDGKTFVKINGQWFQQ